MNKNLKTWLSGAIAVAGACVGLLAMTEAMATTSIFLAAALTASTVIGFGSCFYFGGKFLLAGQELCPEQNER